VPDDRKGPYNAYVGKEIIFGMRPEHVHAPEFAPPNILASPMEASVEVVELLGHEQHLFLNSGRNSLVATVDTRMNVTYGNKIGLVMDMTNMHLFDKNTEEAIR
jgi:multiple sugar transport system ATP-binding protein